MQKKFWKPTITSQFRVCCVPYHMDTYRGCTYGCLYCFARDLSTFARRNSQHKQFEYLVANNYNSFQRWVNRVIEKQIDYNKPEQVAFKERVPLKIGATSDPFPYIQRKEKVTYNFLKILQKIDYPVQISTKNPQVFLQYADEFIGANIALNVTLTTIDESFSKVIEPFAISPSRRLQAIKQLTQKGFNIFVRIQPFVYPQIMKQMQEFICKLKESGVFGFQTEGLKYRVTMPKHQRQIFQKIGDYLGFDIKQYFKQNGVHTGGDYEYNEQIKKEVYLELQKLSNKYGLKFYVADNYLVQGIGCGSECCGTEYLRDYKIFPLNKRTKFYKQEKQFTQHLQKCKINFLRSIRNKGKNIQQVMKEE